MRFQITAVLAALATLVVADHTVEFINQDSQAREIIFTAALGHAAIPTASLPGGATYTQAFPLQWQGNWFLINAGAAVVPGMLGEVQFDGFNGQHYFDVSAIVNPADHSGVKEIYPKQAKSPMSGCQTFPCSNCYNAPDDVQTMSSAESDFVCLIGNKSATRRHARHFVTGHHA